jgi:hypothetical protein
VTARQRHALEEAADELARLDTTCTLAPPCASEALRLAVIAGLDGLDGSDAERRSAPYVTTALRQLAAAAADPAAVDRTPASLLRWEAFVAEEERRVRGGGPLSVSRLRGIEPALGTDDDLDALLREPAGRRPALERAAEVAARLALGAPPTTGTALGELAAALVLCGAGRTDRVRLLPFAAVTPAARANALEAWRAGEWEDWASLACEALARAARGLGGAVGGLQDLAEEADAALGDLGRAAITARAAFGVLKEGLVVTMPALADRLGVSRPAAGDALERLVAQGIAVELTGRRRDRVFAYEAALSIAAAAAAS